MTDDLKNLSTEDKEQKIQSLRDMITTAEQTMQSAKAMLLQLEGKKKVGRRKKIEDDGEGNVVQGTFDGQIMMGTDGKQYPIPANYASKSKLVEGDFLKLTIVGNGQFIYKQIGPVPRQNKIGIVGQDASGNYFVAVDGKPYKVLLASITYFDVQPGDQVAIVTSQDENAQWASIEALLQHNDNPGAAPAIESLNNIQPAVPETPKTANAILTGSAGTASEMLDAESLSEPEEESDTITVEDEPSELDNDSGSITFIDDEENDIIDESASEAPAIEEVVEEDISDEDTALDEDTTAEEPASDDIVDEWVPDIDEIEKEIRAEMQKTD